MLKKQIGWNFDNTYAKLPKSLLSKLKPTPVKFPETIVFNYDLSNKIGLDFSEVNKKEIASIFSGNKLPTGSETISQAYAGHQFGYFTILGDGRAHLIGEHVTKNLERFDIQFKGSGQTPYSRNADGRAALSPMLREYLISESMYYLGVPTTRSLAVIKTGENVLREKKLEGAILTRLASSHIRVGTFQYALVSKDFKNLQTLFDYTIKRHYPHLKNKSSSALELLKIVMEKQINLVVNWMRIGFVHGVMNTDNMTVSGETIDYGPCAFMDVYDPNTVFSSIDQYGRYAYYNQPRIAKWNLERFAECLLPLIDSNKDKSLEMAKEVLNEFPERYKKLWLEMMKNKLGLDGEQNSDQDLIIELLTWMHEQKADYTNTFCFLMNKLNLDKSIYKNESFSRWKSKWNNRSKLNKNSPEQSFKMMLSANPLIIPRNHIVEDSLKKAEEENDLDKFNDLLYNIKKSKHENLCDPKYQSAGDSSKKYKTFCGT